MRAAARIPMMYVVPVLCLEDGSDAVLKPLGSKLFLPDSL